MNTVLISLLMRCWTIFCLQYSRNHSWDGLGTSSEQSLVEFYIILLEGHLQVSLEILEVEICFSLQSPESTIIIQWRPP
jgi:hypothetical protein